MCAGAGKMFEQTRTGKANRAGIHRFTHESRHLRDIVRRRRLMVDRAVAHDKDAQGGMGDVAGHIHSIFARRQTIQIIGESFPIPVQPFIKNDAGDFFDAFHQLDQRLLMLRQHGSKADAAISANRCGHAMREARVEPVIPEELAVIMGVDVDKAGGDDGASCVNFLARCTGDRADFNDQAVLDRHVSGIARCARAINDGAAANDHIVHVCVPGLRSECDIMHTTGIGANAIRTRHIFAAFITRDPFAKIFR